MQRAWEHSIKRPQKPFRRRQQCLSGIPQRICTYALEQEGGELTFQSVQLAPDGVQQTEAQKVLSRMKKSN